MGRIKMILQTEFLHRISRLRAAMDKHDPDWGTVILVGRVNQYYFAGSMQDGLLIIRHDGTTAYFVRRSFDRAREDSALQDVYPMASYRDAASVIGADCGKTYLETELMPLAMLERLRKAFHLGSPHALDRIVLSVRAVKSPAEIALMTESGRLHQKLLDEVVPTLLHEGMTEVELTGRMQLAMHELGYQGITRFGMFQTEIGIGQLGFGENSLLRTSFDGPGGMKGMSPAVPLIGSRERKLAKGDLVFVDVAFGVEGYHTDRTQVYRFGEEPTAEMVRLHTLCRDIEREAAASLRPGVRPSDIYKAARARVSPELEPNFMGFAGQTVRFLGHGVGLQIDEYPVLTTGFDEPLQAGMTIALEPKIGMAGIGMVGVEDTYVVTPDGGRCLTGGEKPIITVPGTVTKL